MVWSERINKDAILENVLKLDSDDTWEKKEKTSLIANEAFLYNVVYLWFIQKRNFEEPF